ncbi:type I phosphomannose isomerase catalytic subunit [Halanaerobaculum tunisiense]
MYPLKFEPVYKEKIWGGSALATEFGRDLSSDSIGESWEVAAHKNGSSQITNGEFAGQELMEVIEQAGVKILGEEAQAEDYQKFPLLIKLLDANDKLSVQVHPDNEYAARQEEGELGKTEMWYVLTAEEGAKLVYGIQPTVTREKFAADIEAGELEGDLVEVEVEAGDVLFIPTGTVHAIEEGILLAEIQQNSDTTYRVYDWDRVGQDGTSRELHIDSALDVIEFGNTPPSKVEGLEIEEAGVTREMLVACPYFITETLDIDDSYQTSAQGDRFYVLMGLEGESNIVYQDGNISLTAGETVLIPASLGNYEIEGDCKILKSYRQDLVDLRSNLEELGYTAQEINQIAGL